VGGRGQFSRAFILSRVHGGKQWQTTLKKLPRMQHTSRLTELWSQPKPAQGPNAYNNVTCGDFHDGSEKGTASVHQILCQS